MSTSLFIDMFGGDRDDEPQQGFVVFDEDNGGQECAGPFPFYEEAEAAKARILRTRELFEIARGLIADNPGDDYRRAIVDLITRYTPRVSTDMAVRRAEVERALGAE